MVKASEPCPDHGSAQEHSCQRRDSLTLPKTSGLMREMIQGVAVNVLLTIGIHACKEKGEIC